MLRAPFLGLAAWQWLGLVVAAALALILGRSVAWFATRLAARVVSRTKVRWDDELVEALRSPARLGGALLVFRVAVEPLALPAGAEMITFRIVGTITTAAIAWVAIRVVRVFADFIERRAKRSAKDVKDERAVLRARGVATQVRVLRRVINVTIGILAAALMLTQFEVVRSIGVSLLASAGIAGVVLGFAAQRTIGSLFAGIQLSATQPIRIGDVVIVEKEWGVIEEITLTYVVVKVWDERRLIVPITRFLEQPFQNWTKTEEQLHGTVFFYVDWRCPVDAVRAELDRIVDGNPKWDGRTKNIQVTDTKERTLEVRALVSAANADALWDLRVEVREKLVRFLQQLDGGKYLPRVRVEEDGGAHDATPARPRPSQAPPAVS